METKSWIGGLREKYRARRRKALLIISLSVAIWLAVSGLVLWSWVEVFHHRPPPDFAIYVVETLGAVFSAAVGPLVRWLPLRRGEPYPEVEAADRFFGHEED